MTRYDPRGVPTIGSSTHVLRHHGSGTNVLLLESRRMAPEMLQNIVVAAPNTLRG